MSIAPLRTMNFPPAALIRLYELLKRYAVKLQTLIPGSLQTLRLAFKPRAVNNSPPRQSSQSGKWWRMTGSNRRPPACKAGALPAELIPRWLHHASLLGQLHSKLCGLPSRLAWHTHTSLNVWPDILVGLVGFEPTTPALSRRCSNRLSYRPNCLHSALSINSR